MTKNEIANKINYKANLARIIMLNYKGAFEVGNIYDNRGKAESWMGPDRTEDFWPELEKVN
jgi:ribosomal protein L30E